MNYSEVRKNATYPFIRYEKKRIILNWKWCFLRFRSFSMNSPTDTFYVKNPLSTHSRWLCLGSCCLQLRQSYGRRQATATWAPRCGWYGQHEPCDPVNDVTANPSAGVRPAAQPHTSGRSSSGTFFPEWLPHRTHPHVFTPAALHVALSWNCHSTFLIKDHSSVPWPWTDTPTPPSVGVCVRGAEGVGLAVRRGLCIAARRGTMRGPEIFKGSWLWL